MFARFNVFLVVKVAERVQQLSREKCSGCVNGLVIDQLHACMQTTLEIKIKMFLPKAKKEALERLECLFNLYKQTNWVGEERLFIESAEHFLNDLEAQHLSDRRFINEDSVVEHPFNLTWLTNDFSMKEDPLAPISTVEPMTKPVKPTKPTRSRKRSKKVNEESELVEFNPQP